MTAWEQIKRQFEAGTVCRQHKQTPLVQHEPGCTFIECARGDDCRCRMSNGDGGPLTPFLAKWQERFA